MVNNTSFLDLNFFLCVSLLCVLVFFYCYSFIMLLFDNFFYYPFYFQLKYGFGALR